ncbi:GNAT family N-acetyltransferase [Natrarchaeobius chitinivorans]|uniref:GNAT family N-acetyltransferase n=1 Tax=Natrarchaeobius chitinivorans TaxID=1679083 RepID=A0A3N6MA01_NATCH|nr:GNAT family N-acetyltransferase [Natrarchaeobius chitinivorans]RQG92241.1 GNAT family N-acetyltransferase [Natrarchaeobius chitinivorans]
MGGDIEISADDTETPTDDESDAEGPLEIRRATHDDYEGVVDFTSDIWADRGGDYLPDIYHEWLEDEDETDRKTFLATVDGTAVGIVQAVMLSPDEAWFQSLRVASDYRRQGVSRRLNEACFEWARNRGATVGRIMVFSWNAASLASARAIGFDPSTEFRFAYPDPDPDATGPASRTISTDPTAAWRYWTHSDARDHLRGLGLASEESWALRELTAADLERFAGETSVIVVEGPDGLSGVAYRSRTYDRRNDDGVEETWAEYGVGAWDDVGAARALFAAISRDAAATGADRTRVAIPETAGFVTDAAATGAGLADEPEFVLEIDLTADGR